MSTSIDDISTMTDIDSVQMWNLPNGDLHRIDGPAVDSQNGRKEWWLNGMRHREGGPAVSRKNGSNEYWINGMRHREDGPAIDFSSGYKRYYLNNEWCTKENYMISVSMTKVCR
jgi:hypothetical protein